jgi:hypothetical protein
VGTFKTYTFKSNDWETIERAWNIPPRRMCVQPVRPLRVKTGIFTTGKSSSGCINYGGAGSVAYQRVQAKGRKGETITITQGVQP